MSLQVSCHEAGAAIRVRALNTADVDVHLFDSDKMPYMGLENGELLVSWAVGAPDPEVDYFGIEIPVTRPLPPGEAFETTVALEQVTLRDHYESDREPTRLSGSLQVRCEFGFTLTPITERDRPEMAIESLIAMQQVAGTAPVRVDLG